LRIAGNSAPAPEVATVTVNGVAALLAIATLVGAVQVAAVGAPAQVKVSAPEKPAPATA
jgi:hypothetical protein